MGALSTVESAELEDRLQTVLGNIDVLLKDIGPKVQKIAHLREEAALLYEELKKRGIIEDGERPTLQGQVSKT